MCLSYNHLWTMVNKRNVQMRVTRLRNLVLLVQGLLASRSGCLSAIVRQWPMTGTRHVHRLKRLHRFLKNEAVPVTAVSQLLANLMWGYRPGGERSRLVPIALDWTKVHQFHVLWAAMPRRKRALPLAHGVYHPDRLRHSQNKLEHGLCALVASWLPEELTPLFLADRGFGRTEFVRWLQQHGFAFVVRLKAETIVTYRGRSCRLGDFDTIEGAPILLSNVLYRQEQPVRVHIVVSRLGDKVWYLGTSLRDPRQAVAWYQKRFWIEEMFRDFKSLLGLRQVRLKDEQRLTRLLLGYQMAYFILSVIGFNVPKRWHHKLASRNRLSTIWVALEALPLLARRRYRRTWSHHIWPALLLETG
jgi:hypothetical protein